jgi:hypothetical protein
VILPVAHVAVRRAHPHDSMRGGTSPAFAVTGRRGATRN